MLSVAKCVLAPLWRFSEADVEEWFSDLCATSDGQVLAPDRRDFERRRVPRHGDCAVPRLLRPPLALQGTLPRSSLLPSAHRQATPLPRGVMAFSKELLQGLRSLGFSAEVPEMRSVDDDTRLRAPAPPAVFRRCVAEVASFAETDEALLRPPPPAQVLGQRLDDGLHGCSLQSWGG